MTVRLRPEADSDLDEAARWYEEQRIGLGSEFLDEVLRVLSAISEQPEGFPVVHKEIRRAVTRRFPFGVYYVIGRTDLIVLAVMHGSRDPSSWKGRT